MTLRHLTKVGGLVLAMSVMASFSLWALVQEIDYTTEQYLAYNKCANLTDPEAKQKCVLDFIEAHRKLSLVEYAIAEYGRALQEQIQKMESFLSARSPYLIREPRRLIIAYRILNAITLTLN